MKIIHSADWQLGKPFGRFKPDVRASLTEARFDAIDSIGKAAEAVSPQAHSFVAEVNAALEEQLFDIQQAQREPDIHHHHKPDHLRRGV